MDILIPFEKEIDFKTNIAEITKISLEEDYSISNMEVLGNFYISGEYKVNDISVNTNEFSYTLPFSVELTNNIKEDTLEFNIEDFNYEIDGTKLKVNIEYSVKGEKEEKEIEFEQIDEDELDEELAFITRSDTEERNDLEVSNEEVESIIENNDIEVSNDKNEVIERNEEIIKTNEVISNINKEDTYVTYHVHIVKEEENEETICKLYNISNSTLKEYNNYEILNIGDKLIIPNE